MGLEGPAILCQISSDLIRHKIAGLTSGRTPEPTHDERRLPHELQGVTGDHVSDQFRIEGVPRCLDETVQPETGVNPDAKPGTSAGSQADERVRARVARPKLASHHRRALVMPRRNKPVKTIRQQPKSKK